MTAPQTPGREQEIRARAEAAAVRLAQYGDRTSTWSTATYNDGTEKALHEIALALNAEVDRLQKRVDEVERRYIFDTAALRADRDAAVAVAVRRALEDAAKRQREFVLSDDFVCDDWESALTVIDLIDPAVASPSSEQGEGGDAR